MHYRYYCEKNNILLVIPCPKEDGGSVQSDLSSSVVKTTWVVPWCWKDFPHIFASGLSLMIRSILLCISCHTYSYIYSVFLCHWEGVIQGVSTSPPSLMISPAKWQSLMKFSPSLSASRLCLPRSSGYLIAGYHSHFILTQAPQKHLIPIWQ